MKIPSGLIGPVGPCVTSPAVQEQSHVREYVKTLPLHAMDRIVLGQTKKRLNVFKNHVRVNSDYICFLGMFELNVSVNIP